MLTCLACMYAFTLFAQVDTMATFCGHKVILDENKKLLPPIVPSANAYDYFLRQRWNFVKTKAPYSPGPSPRSSYPQYYFYCAFVDKNGKLEPDMWMNDVGEKIPNWFESARLYYAYTGDMEPLSITKRMVDYSIKHGVTPSDYSWPGFPQSAADAGALEFRGFTTAKRFSTDDVQVDHAGDLGATYYKMYLFYDDIKYKTAAINVANVLVKKIRKGTAAQSPWPYVVNMKSGKIVSDYGTNWFGCLKLFDMLIETKSGNVNAYKKARKMLQDWVLQYPVVNGNWVDGHTDTYITGTDNLSNMSASNAGLFISDFHDFDTAWKKTIPALIKWTEKNFIDKSAPGEPSVMWGANLVSEQVAFMPKMDYQTARYAAQCARWYAVTGNEEFKEKAFRSLNWVTYCNDSSGKAYESPVSKNVNSWWSDTYGECPQMFYHVFAAVPEWAPVNENHILYSAGILKNISYAEKKIQYTATQKGGTEYLRLTFKPSSITINGVKISLLPDSGKEGYDLTSLGHEDYAVTIKRTMAGNVIVKAQ